MADLPRPLNRAAALDDASFPGFAMGAAAAAIGVTPAFLRAVEAAGLFEVARSDGGHRRYSRDDLQRADRARELVDDGTRLDAAVRIVDLWLGTPMREAGYIRRLLKIRSLEERT